MLPVNNISALPLVGPGLSVVDTAVSAVDGVLFAFGRCLQSASESFDSMHAQVSWLRSNDFRIRTDDELMRVRDILGNAQTVKQGVAPASTKSLMSYARILRGLLSCQELPESFTLTKSIQAPCYEVGDEIDGQFTIDVKIDGKLTTKMEWMAGIVINKRCLKQGQPYEVFGLGIHPGNPGATKILRGCHHIFYGSTQKELLLVRMNIGKVS